MAGLLKRLLAGEEPNPKLFSEVVEGLEILEKAEVSEITNTETTLVAHILQHLGYMELGTLPENSRQVLPLINKALKETHL